jgi:hypothetical protein
MFSKSQTAFGKKFVTTFLRDIITTPATMTGVAHASNVVQLYHPLTEVRVHNPAPSSYTVVNINPYTLEEQLVLYPTVMDEAPQRECTVVQFK